MTGTSLRRERFLPYAYERAGLELEITSCTRDDGSASVGDGRVLELVGEWRESSLQVRAHVAATTRARLVPPNERAEPPLALLVGLRCEPTRLRRGEVLPLVGEEALGTIAIRREELAGTAELHAWLVRTKPLARRVAGYAHMAGARVAHALAWSIVVDRERSAAARGLEVLFKSFRTDPAIPAKERANLYRLDCAQETPILWLNADLETIAPLLQSEGTRGTRARIRDVAFDRIVASVRTQLVLRAATHASGEGAVYGWENAILDEMLPRLYPEVAASDRLARLRDAMTDPAELVARLDDLNQAHEHTAEAMRKLLEDA